ncbi:helix-turn-helix domain-containing protein [Streptomyces sp. NBC_01310]|uniref:helix-turn-helix domain-containing protein n=1 Tax=Streptomyces sp. NBC_01310 TaxID=2903820 RepID=UPI0035B6581E|nr:helix-turn-helix domain-containing protein [Streptomyces sp. NBC_01310]
MPPVDPAFGEEMRRRRTASGMSLADLAAKVHYSKEYLSKIERGMGNPSDQLAQSCDAKLRAGGLLFGLLNRPLPHAGDVSAVSAAESGSPGPWSLRLRADGASDFTACDPAAPAEDGTTTVAAKWALTPGFRENGSVEETLTVFRTLLDQQRRLGQCSGPAVVAPMSIAATAALRGLGRGTPPAQRGALLQLAAHFAEYTGWMAQEAGDDPAARWWTGQAAGLAKAGGDDEMAAYALLRQAEIALYQGDSLSTVALAGAAGAQARGRRTRELAAQREAQGHALMGNESECRRALDRAGELASGTRPQGDGGPALGGTHLPDLTAFVTGWCLRELGEAEEAVALLDIGQDGIAPHALRARARHGARLALALADAGEVERACAVAASVAQDVMTTDSATVRTDLKQLRSSLAPRRKHPAVSDTLPVIAASLRAGADPRGGGG